MAQVIWKTVPLSPTRHLYHRAVISSMRVRADLPNTERQTQTCIKIGRQRNMHQMKEQEKYLEKELNEMEATKIPNVEFKTMKTTFSSKAII